MQQLLYQQSAYATLDRLWAGGRFPHALLIEGAAGSGKRTLAHYAAAMLLCRGEGKRPCTQIYPKGLSLHGRRAKEQRKGRHEKQGHKEKRDDKVIPSVFKKRIESGTPGCQYQAGV